jgi:hypothetical protein
VSFFDAMSGLNRTALQESFLGTRIPFDQQGVTTRFAQSKGSPNVDCFGQTFLSDAQPSP